MSNTARGNIVTMPRDRSRSPAKEEPSERPICIPLGLASFEPSLVKLVAGTKSGVELPQYDTMQRFAIELRDAWLEMPYGPDRGYMGQEPFFITEGGRKTRVCQSLCASTNSRLKCSRHWTTGFAVCRAKKVLGFR